MKDSQGAPVVIREDAAGHDHGPGNDQNRGPHFNDEAKKGTMTTANDLEVLLVSADEAPILQGDKDMALLEVQQRTAGNREQETVRCLSLITKLVPAEDELWFAVSSEPFARVRLPGDRHWLGLWRELARRGFVGQGPEVMAPFDEKSLRCFGLCKVGLTGMPSALAVLRWVPNSFFLLAKSIELAPFVTAAWAAGGLLSVLPLAREAERQGSLFLRPFGSFDDVETGVQAVGSAVRMLELQMAATAASKV